MFHDPTFWVAIAFLLFIALLVFFKLPSTIADALDSRAVKIKNDLDEAENLLKKAQDLLATYQKKQRDAADDAMAIKLSAEKEAERLTVEGEERLIALLQRREELIIERIAQAEAKALSDLKARTADIAMDATQEILATMVSPSKSDEMLNEAISSLSKRLN